MDSVTFVEEIGTDTWRVERRGQFVGYVYRDDCGAFVAMTRHDLKIGTHSGKWSAIRDVERIADAQGI